MSKQGKSRRRRLSDIKIRYAAIGISGSILILLIINFSIVRTMSLPEDLLVQRNFVEELRLEIAEISPDRVQAAPDSIDPFMEINHALDQLEAGGMVMAFDQDFELPEPSEGLNEQIAKTKAALTTYQEQSARSNSVTNPLKTRYKYVVENGRLISMAVNETLHSYKSRLNNVMWIVMAFSLVVMLLIGLFLFRLMLTPVFQISKITRKLAIGNLDQKIELSNRNEVGYIARNINDLAEMLRKASSFTKKIGEGNLDAQYSENEGEIEEDTLAGSLIQMREQMKSIAEEDRQRAWSAEGLARFGEILRKEADNLEMLSRNLLSELVAYLNCTQGNLYTIADNDGETVLELQAAWAFDREKHHERTIKPGEGLIGQLYLEGKTLNMTDIPEDYLHINSGLGDAPPRNLIVVPLQLNEESHGIIELASFNLFQPYQVEFLERLGEAIASSLHNAKVAQQTQVLLAESQQRAQEIQAQEEEMRQNMEELQATQEEMSRKEREYLATIAELKEKLGE